MMHSLRANKPGRGRDGLTLIELLIVMAIVVLLAGLTLPSVKNLLKDQKIGQAARVVQGFAESAKARAIASGRRVALVLERARTDDKGGAGNDSLIANDTCIRMSLGEVFPPYEGDWSGTTATVYDKSGDGFVDWMEIPAAQAASLTGSSPMVSTGDLVELADRNQGFIISGVKSGNSASGTPVVQLALANPPYFNGKQCNEPIWPLTPALDSGAEVSFRIYRTPSKMMAGSVVLPRGTCVDLSMSGVGPSGRDFSTFSINAPTGSTASAGDFGAVYLVFSPRGTLELAYYQSRTSSGVPSVVRVLPNGIFHLLIGRTDQVDPLYGTSSSVAAVSTRDDFKANLVDPANVWVSVNPYSGMIYSSQLTLGDGTVSAARALASVGAQRPGK
jgi:prepilin-type N-terminal cleavage/methylation domain-containing protein